MRIINVNFYKITSTLISAIIFFSLPSPIKAICPTDLNTTDVTMVSNDICSIPSGTTFVIDKAATEDSSINLGELRLSGGTLTIPNTAILKTPKLIPGGGIIYIQTGGQITIGGANTGAVWVTDADADGYAANFTTYTATAAGRRRAGLMKSHTMADCDDTNIGITSRSSTGGTISYSGGYVIHTFTSSGTFNLTCGGDTNIEYLIVAGGGGSGGTTVTASSGGGGGAGGLLTGTTQITTGNFPVTIGTGGSAGTYTAGSNGGNGGNSVWNGLTAIGGGGGGGGLEVGTAKNGSAGGSGGGGGGKTAALGGSGGTATSGQGTIGGIANSGQSGGAGGGAGGAGLNSASGGSTTGGVGLASSISGSSITYAVGGTGFLGEVGTANRGNGGGGKSNSAGRAGGSGIVILRYQSQNQPVSGTYYADLDGDGYGAGSPIVMLPAAGYVDNNYDCYDSNINAYPGSTTCSSTDRGDGSYDYDCSSTSTKCGTSYNLTQSTQRNYSTCYSYSCGYTNQTVYSSATINCGQAGYSGCAQYSSIKNVCSHYANETCGNGAFNSLCVSPSVSGNQQCQ